MCVYMAQRCHFCLIVVSLSLWRTQHRIGHLAMDTATRTPTSNATLTRHFNNIYINNTGQLANIFSFYLRIPMVFPFMRIIEGYIFYSKAPVPSLFRGILRQTCHRSWLPRMRQWGGTRMGAVARYLKSEIFSKNTKIFKNSKIKKKNQNFSKN